MKVIRGHGKERCERTIDFSRKLKFYDEPTIFAGKGFSIPVIEKDGGPSEVYFWENETIRATIGKDKYFLSEHEPKFYAQLKNNVELLFALHDL